MRAPATIVGFALFLLGTGGVFVTQGGAAIVLTEAIVLLLGIVAAIVGSALMAFGCRRVLETLGTVRLFAINSTANPPSEGAATVLGYAIKSTYATGSCVLMLCLIIVMAHVGGPLEPLGHSIAHCLCSVIFTILIAELFLRPLKARVESALVGPSTTAQCRTRKSELP